MCLSLLVDVCENIDCCDGSIACKEEECPKLTTSGKLEVCFALDESGSVCSKRTNPCSNPRDRKSKKNCYFNRLTNKMHPYYCPKFNTYTKNFVYDFIADMDELASGWGASTKYAIATFSESATKDQDLRDSATTINTVKNLEFTGGVTQTAEGMEACQDLLLNGDPDADKLLIVVTDGRPRKNSADPPEYFDTTISYATNIKSGKKAAGGGNVPAMKIIAIGVKSTEDNLSFVQQLASPGHSLEITEGYAALEGKVSSIVSDAIATSCAGVTPLTVDSCPNDPLKTEPGICGCGMPDTDSDSDGTVDCQDKCPNDPRKTEPGVCGCGAADTDSDGDGIADCNDICPHDSGKTAPGACGCGTPDTDGDGDGKPDCGDSCPNDPNKIEPGECGCGTPDTDSDGDGTVDCLDECPYDPLKIKPGVCGCSTPDKDSDGDGIADCNDNCPRDPDKTQPGECGCGVSDIDSDGDGIVDCKDGCSNDPDKTAPGACGCGIADTDSDGDGIPDCTDGMYKLVFQLFAVGRMLPWMF